MGEVYRARDTKLNRDVAIKVLPDLFVRDAERLARFTREAQTLASLNHPNIAQIHGLEESNGVRALVMELVEGEDLSQRIARGPIRIDEALPIARQIAEALDGGARARHHPSRSETGEHQIAQRTAPSRCSTLGSQKRWNRSAFDCRCAAIGHDYQSRNDDRGWCAARHRGIYGSRAGTGASPWTSVPTSGHLDASCSKC